MRLWEVDENNRPIRLLCTRKNLVTYEGSDILARIAGGDTDYQIDGMYFQFSNDVSPAAVSPDRADDVSVFTGLAGANDAVRSALTGTPSYSPSGGDFVGNVVTFWAIANASQGSFHSVSFSAGASSKIVGAALVAMLDPDDKTKDKIFSRVAISPALALASSSRPALEWLVTFP